MSEVASYYQEFTPEELKQELDAMDQELRDLHEQRAALYHREELVQEHRHAVLQLLGVIAIDRRQG